MSMLAAGKGIVSTEPFLSRIKPRALIAFERQQIREKGRRK
jgi:hypothetical protein